MAKKRVKKYVKKDVRKRQIYELLLNTNVPVTMGEILRHMRLGYGPHIRLVFDEMVSEKFLTREYTRLRGNLYGYVYKAYDPFRQELNT